jgi:hypothetical protein
MVTATRLLYSNQQQLLNLFPALLSVLVLSCLHGCMGKLMCATAENMGHVTVTVLCVLPAPAWSSSALPWPTDGCKFEDSLYRLQCRYADTLLIGGDDLPASVSASWDGLMGNLVARSASRLVPSHRDVQHKSTQ